MELKRWIQGNRAGGLLCHCIQIMVGTYGEGIQWSSPPFLANLADKQAKHLCGAVKDPLPMKFLNTYEL